MTVPCKSEFHTPSRDTSPEVSAISDRVPRTPREGCPYSNRDVVGAVPYSPNSIRPG